MLLQIVALCNYPIDTPTPIQGYFYPERIILAACSPASCNIKQQFDVEISRRIEEIIKRLFMLQF